MLTCSSCSNENPEGQKFCGECGSKLEATPAHEERKVITALFCDLVGSTALGERLDAEDISRLLRSYQGICRARIQSHGGVVEKFIGDAVVGVFGVPLAHEDDSERAVRAALRITEDVGASELGIEVRIGVNTGEALVRLNVDSGSGEGFATGDTMNTAARLEAAAPVMGVAVGALTHQASAATIVYEALPAITAKGKAEPVPVWRAIRPIAWVGTEERDRTPFVGRHVELSMLTQLFDRSRSRPSTEFITIIAEPGLGKSRLVRELARHVDGLPEFVTWREGRCLPYGDGISFWALGEIVKAHAGILETDDEATVSSKLDAVVSDTEEQTRTWIKDRLAPLVGLETTAEPPQREEAFTAWRRFLEAITTAGPTVLVVEDLHWADEAFVAFLEHLAERTAGLPLLVVVTARPEVEERHPSWPPGRRSTVLSLSPLTDKDLEALITQSLPEADPELIRIVLERAGMSPLYAEQLAAMLRERTLPIVGGALDETLIPSSVQALIAARIDALPAEPKRVLMEASVVGKTFWLGAVSALGQHEDVEATLGELVRREFCRPVHPSTMQDDLEFGFWHALVRDVAYAELTKVERARMHASTARWIEREARDGIMDLADVIAFHYKQAIDLTPSSATNEDVESRRELEYQTRKFLILAGDRELTLNVAKALETYRSALDMTPIGDGERAYVLLKAARAAAEAGTLEEASAMFDEALHDLRTRGDLLAAGDAAVGLSGVLSRRRLPHREMVDEALELLEQAPAGRELVTAYSRKGGITWFLGELGEALAWADRGVGLAEELGGGSILSEPLSVRGSIRVEQGDIEGGVSDLRAALAVATRSGLGMQAFTCYNNLGFVVSRNEGEEATIPITEATIKWCEQHGLEEGEKWSRLSLVDSRRTLGDWAGFLTGIDELLASLTDRFAAIKGLALSQKAYVLAYMGDRTGEARILSREAIQRTRVEEPHPTELQEVLTTEAVVERLSGDPRRASEIIKEVLENEMTFGVSTELIHFPNLFRAASEDDLERLEEAVHRSTATFRDEEAAYAACEGILAEHHGDPRQASERFAAASELWTPFSVFERGQALLGAGRCKLALREDEMARDFLEHARTIFRELGARPSLDEAETLLAKWLRRAP